MAEWYVTVHMDNGAITLLIVYVRRRIQNLKFAEINIRLVDIQVLEVEGHCFIAYFHRAVEFLICGLKWMGVVSIHSTDLHGAIRSLIKGCPELLREEVVRVLAAEVDLIVIYHKHGRLLHQNLVFWRGRK